MGLTKIVFLLAAPLALCGSVIAATAGECSGSSNALGTSRTIVVDPREHGRIGTMNYSETLPLFDKEVVLTFDDGPLPPYTNRILDILASDCVRATYFIVGSMAKVHPELIRRAYNEGHTIGTHSMTHPNPFQRQGIERTKVQIDDGIAATAAALGHSDKLAPFFRFPGFGHTPPAEEYAASRGLMVWGADFPADDWRRIGANEVARRAMQRLEAKGKGILVLHDIHARTVDALPTILKELKARGYRIVHVVPASADRPPTVTTAEAWRPNSRPKLAAPVILIAEVQEPDGDSLMKRSAAELCSLNLPVHESASRIATRKRSRLAGVVHVDHMPKPTTLDIHAVR